MAHYNVGVINNIIQWPNQPKINDTMSVYFNTDTNIQLIHHFKYNGTTWIFTGYSTRDINSSN